MTAAFTRRPVLCLVTDRRRVGAGDDARAATAALVAQARHAADAGIDLIQVRERDLEASQLVDLAGAIVDAVRGSGTRVVVNDRIDAALASRAAGVHLRGDSPGVSRARALLPLPRLIGRSVHSPADARQHPAADYLIAGTTYATLSKAGPVSLLGADGLRAIVAAAAPPVLAIGGVTIERAGEIAATGAAGVAAIGLFLGDGDGPSAVVPLRDRVTELHRRFAAGR